MENEVIYSSCTRFQGFLIEYCRFWIESIEGRKVTVAQRKGLKLKL